jgi:penicillin-binding protein 1C
VLILLGALVIAASMLWLLCGPVPRLDVSHFTSTTILDRNGVPLYEPLSADGHRGQWLDSRSVPRRVAQATIAAEDKRFASHIGIDPVAIARAALHDVRRCALVEGGSTITQQVAKLMTSDGAASRRGFIRKLRETVLALRLERRYTKGAILAAYVNLAPYGNQIHGIARASRRYFGCAPEDLTVSQAAFLASLPQRPGAFNPLRDPNRAATRQKLVLRRMRALGFISRAEFEIARRERLRFDRGGTPVIAQHFIERVLESSSPRGAGRIVTTLDSRLQRDVAGIVAAHRDDLLRHGAHSVAVAVLDNGTGEWLAWEGSGDYFGSTFGGAIDGVVALRQPGSTLKPFTYALAFEHGESPATVLPDVAASFPTAEDGVVYSPRNYDGRYRGPLRARAALAGSENVPAVALLSQLGPAALLRLLHNAGFSDFSRTADYYGLGLTLGDAEVRLEQLVAAYAIFARGGLWIEPRMIRSAVRGEGAHASAGRRIVSQRTAFWITDILSDPKAREFIFGRGGSLEFPFAVAVKTGTSQAYHDNWTIGYTRDVTVGVWVGNFDRQELHGSSGVTGAGPIFHDVMLASERRLRGASSFDENQTIVEPPADLVRAPICALSGLRPSTACPAVESEWVPSDEPVRFCSWHHQNGIAWPDEYRAWARQNAMLGPPPITSRTATLARNADRKPHRLRILNPPDGATYLIDPTLRMRFQTLHLRAMSGGAVAWDIDQRAVGRALRDGVLDWPLAPGRHTITAVDGYGNRSSVRIYVK